MPSSIRILQIDPGAPSDPITCHFRVVNLDESPNFTALSYSWQKDTSLLRTNISRKGGIIGPAYGFYKEVAKGILGCNNSVDDAWPTVVQQTEQMWENYSKGNVGDAKLIFCDGKKMMIQANLYEAMVRLRRLRPTNYWIDAICINQQDLRERSQQVQMMGRIYGCAEEVVIWLGNMTSLAAHPFQTLFSLFGPKLNKKNAVPGNREDHAETRSDSVVVVTDEELDTVAKEHGSDREELLDMLRVAAFVLLTRRWFRRLWVVQESRQARQTLFLFGESQFSANLISSVLRWIEDDMARSRHEPDYDSTSGLLALLDVSASIWNVHLKHIPATLDSMSSSHGGEKWTLQQWLFMAKGRKASDAKDLVFAGLSLIRPEHLIIDQSFQAQDKVSHTQQSKEHVHNESSNRRDKLWDMLHVDYNAETSTVLLNLAACILSHYDLHGLLEFTLRFRCRPSYATLTELPVTTFPSWIPDPTAWTSKTVEPVISLNNPGCPFPCSVHMSNSKPQISFDGTKLAVTAALLDTVSYSCPILDVVLNIKDCAGAIRVLNWIAEKVPRVYHPTGCSGIEALARLIASAYRNQNDLERPCKEETMARGFCEMLHELFEVALRDGLKSWNEALDYWQTWVKLFPWPSGWVMDYDGVFKAYAKLRAAHPDAPWPPSSLAGSQGKEVVNPENEIPPDNLNGASKTSITGQKRNSFDIQSDLVRDTGDAASTRDSHQESAWGSGVLNYNSGVGLQSLFVTKEGYLGIGPNWLRSGDGVFLVADAKAPYILAQVDDVLQRQAREIREQLDTGMSRSVKLTRKQRKSLQIQLLEIESRPRGENAWQLVGEAYVEGVMNGEAAGLAEAWAQRYDIA